MGGLLVGCKKWVSLHKEESLKWQDSAYLPNVTARNVLMWTIKGVLCQLVLSYFFYKSWWAVWALIPLLCGFIFIQWRNWQKQVLLDIEMAFKDWLFCVKGGVSAGKSVEQAILKSKNVFASVIPIQHPIHIGLEQIYRGLELQIPVEQCIYKMGKETGIEVIENFAVVFEISKKRGANMTNTLEKTIRQIYESIELRMEIQSMIAAKKMEQKIMCVMPFGILFFVGNASGGYFESLYHNVKGVVVMTICMCIYLLGVWWGERLTEVTV